VRRPQVLILQAPFAAEGIQAALEEAGYEVCAPPGELDPWLAVRDLERAPELLLLPVDDEELEGIRRLRRVQALARVPILGVARGCGPAAAFEPLRSLGVVGLVDARTPVEHVVFRVEQIVCPRRSGRRYERAPVFFGVDVAPEGQPSRVLYAATLSVGGLGLLSDEPIEPNTDVSLRFRLSPSVDDLALTGRVVYCHEEPSAPGMYRLGLFFYPLEESVRRRLADEVERRLRT
jgi:hypothetical protein